MTKINKEKNTSTLTNKVKNQMLASNKVITFDALWSDYNVSWSDSVMTWGSENTISNKLKNNI